MTKVHLISVSAALALGYAGGFASDNIVSATSKPLEESANVCIDLPAANPVAADIFSKADVALCDDAEAEAGLDVGDCTVNNVRVVRVVKNDDDTYRACAGFRWSGTWTIGAPQ